MRLILLKVTLLFIAFISASNLGAQQTKIDGSQTKTKPPAASKNKIHYITDTSVNFDNLVSRFRGKVVFVDIWATWCSPCRQELLDAKKIKGFQQFAVKNDIIILYICCDKNESKWEQFISAEHLAGYHILVNKYLDHDFHTRFSSIQRRQGDMKRGFYIPRHIIIDRTGMVADSTADEQGSKKLYAELNGLLHKPGK